MTLRRRARLALAALAASTLALGLTGCFSGQQATTNVQATQASGDGVSGTVGNMKVNNATVVLGPTGSGSATVIMTVTDIGTDGDSLIAATIAGGPATLVPTTDGIVVAPYGSVNIGYVGATSRIDVFGFEAVASTYVPVTLTFEKSGPLRLSAMVVEPNGIYTGIAPGLPQ